MQEAIKHSPGMHSAVILYEPQTDTAAGRRDLIRAAAQVMLLFKEDPDRMPSELRVLVGFSLSLLNAAVADPGGHDVVPAALPDGPLRADAGNQMNAYINPADKLVLVQIAASTEAARRFALRCLQDLMTGKGTAVAEWQGSRIRGGEEVFGFGDSSDYRQLDWTDPAQTGNYVDALGGSWLYFQHFEQNVAAFYDARPTVANRAAVIGKAPAMIRPRIPHDTRLLKRSDVLSEAEAKGRKEALDMEAKPNSHVSRMSPFSGSMLRRSFPVRVAQKVDGALNVTEGLAFLAVSGGTAKFQEALDVFNGGTDPLEEFVEARTSGLFYCPNGPDAGGNLAFIAGALGNPVLGPATIAMQDPADLTSHELAVDALKYIVEGGKLVTNGTAGDMLWTILDKPLTDLEQYLSTNGGGTTTPAQFRSWREAARRSSKLLRTMLAKYFVGA